MQKKLTLALISLTLIVFTGLTTYGVYKQQGEKIEKSNQHNVRCQTRDMDPETMTDKFHSDMHKEIVQKIVKNFPEKKGLLLVGGVKTDYARQERPFLYLSGVFLWSWGQYLIIDLATGKTILFSEKLKDFEAIWHLRSLPTKDEIKEKFGQDEVYWVDEFEAVMKKLNPSKIWTTKSLVVPSNPTNAQVDKEFLDEYLDIQRGIKTQKELRLMRVTNRVATNSHLAIMKNIGAGLNEHHMESLWKFSCGNCGLKEQAYHPIIGNGRNAAILHYNLNDMKLKGDNILLIDAGPNYWGYASDVTSSYPVGGKFNNQHRTIYTIVYEAQKKGMTLLRDGVTWKAITDASSKKLLEGLRSYGFVRGDIDEMFEKRVHGLFMPHSLGHHTGLDVHDGQRLTTPGLVLRKNMVLVLEPGCYFLSFLFESAKDEQKKFLNFGLIRQYYEFGGVRIEDNFIINQNGYEKLNEVPREIKDIEQYMRK